MVQSTPQLKRLFREFENDERRGNCQKTAIFGAVFMMVGMSLDKIVYPEMLWEFFYNRLLTSSLMVVLGLLVIRITNDIVVRVVTHAVVLLPFVSICHMIVSVDGASSPYYAGLNLVLMGAALIVKWGIKDSVANAIISLLLFALTLQFHGSVWDDSFIPLYFVFVTACIVCMGAFMYERRKFREFCLVQEVEDANARLEGSNAQLKAMDETKSRFFANISHELRTPLTLILGPTESLMAKPRYSDDADLSNQLGMIEKNALRLLRMINDILDLVKLDSGENTPRNESIDIGAFMNDLARNLQSIAVLKNIHLSCRNEVPKGELVWLDRDRLEKIILNLSMNAIKFTPEQGSVEISVRIDHAIEQLSIAVADTGEGLSKDDQKNVFVRFWQADMSAKRKHRGAGIGLALVKNLCDSMGGMIKVESELGKGTTFSVSFPHGASDISQEVDQQEAEDVIEIFNKRARWQGAAVDPAVQAATNQSTETSPVKPASEEPVDEDAILEIGKTVLVADDEELMRDYIARQLENHYTVLTSHDGTDAWERIKESKPDLLVLDMMMPGMDGVELTRTVRADPELGRTPIILVTAQASEKPRLEALAAGVNDFITKPFSSVELQARIGNLLKSSEFEVLLAESHRKLEDAFEQLKEQEAILVQSEKLSSLGRMSAGIVHEVNNPLNYARTALHALGTFDRELPEEEREDFIDVLGDAREGVDRVVNIVSDLRAFTRGDSSQLSRTKINEVVESARRLCSDCLSGIDFVCEAKGDFYINANEGQLCQLFVNFFQNASRAIQVAERDQGAITVKLEEIDGRVLASVCDNGCGISDEDKPKIFDPFFTKNDVGEGMGLGLSICSKIIEQHQATVEVDSTLGESTCIRVSFAARQ